nr:insulysin insulin degrading enzyme [Mimivirus sp.]
MASTGQKRGASNFSMNEILGPKFKEFVDVLESQKLEPFLFKNMETDNTRTYTSKYAPNDIHYDFSEYVIAASAAFKRIENPDLGKAEAAEGYAENISTIFDELVSGKQTSGARLPNVTRFQPKQFVFEYDPSNVATKYLLPGYHLLPYDIRNYSDINNQPSTALVNAIKYLYHYIALLNVQSADATEIINTLKYDNIYFNRYVTEIVNDISTRDYFKTPVQYAADTNNLVRDAVLNGLTSIAWQIITKFRNNSVEESKLQGVNIGNIPETAFTKTSSGELARYLTESVAAPRDTFTGEIKDVFNNLNNLDKLATIGTDAKLATLGLSKEAVIKYNVDALLNPEYILDPRIIKSVSVDELNSGILSKTAAPTAPPVAPLGTGTGIPTVPKTTPTAPGDQILSLRYLYNTTGTGDKAVLVTENQGTSGSKIVDVNLVKVIPDLVNSISGVGQDIGEYTAGSGYGLVRAILLAISYYMIVNQVTFEDLKKRVVNVGDMDHYGNIIGLLREISKNYAVFENRLRLVPKNQNYNDLRDAFISEFTLTSYKSFERSQTGEYGTRTTPITSAKKTSNLQDPEIYDFYKNTVANKPDFYSQFFNLVRTDSGSVTPDVNITEAVDKQGADLAKYRLNVRKVSGYSRFSEGQRGGLYGDVIFISRIPDYPANGSIGRVWLSRDQFVDVASLNSRGSEALRTIARNVYYSPTSDTVQIYNIPIQVDPIIRSVARMPLFSLNNQNYFGNLLRASVTSSISPTLTPAWKENETRLSEHILRHDSKWERIDDDFVLKGPDGNVVDHKFVNNCAFIGSSEQECLDVLSQCLAPNGQSINDRCSQLTDFNFNVDLPVNKLKEEVMKINPFVAFNILRQFGFASYLTEEKFEPIRNFRRYKVQSVGSWLKELVENSDRCRNPNISNDPCKPQTLRQYLGDAVADKILAMAKDPSKFPFFNYLDMLVEWVNANPQALNPEESKYTKASSKYPNVNDSFRTYDYLNPYKPAYYRRNLGSLNCGLERLKSNIVNELSGLNGHAFISNIASIPSEIQMPLSRSSFVSPVPFGNFVPIMSGGNFYELENELKNINNQYGYTLFNQIYVDLLETMRSMQGDRKINLSEHTKEQISEKLENFKRAEDALRESVVRTIERNKLYQASRGYINPFNVPSDKLPAVLAKHSNLLHLSSAYNKKAINLIDLFKTISEAIMSKLGDAESKSMYTRPLSATYH